MDEPQITARKWDFDRVFRLFLVVSSIVAVFWLMRVLSEALIPFALALLLAYLLNPVVDAFESRLKGRRGPAVGITVFGAFVICSVVLIVLVPITVNEMKHFGQQLQKLEIVQSIQDGSALLEKDQAGEYGFVTEYETLRAEQPEWVRNVLDQAVASLADTLNNDLPAMGKSLASRVLPGLWDMVSGVLSFLLGLTGLVIVLLYTVFILMDYERVSRLWPAILPPQQRPGMRLFIEEFTLAMRCYFRGQFLVACLVGILFAVGFEIIGLRMGILLGLFVGMLNMVPYLQAVGLFPALLMGLFRALETGSNPLWSLALVLIVFGVVQLIQDAVITPKIMGKVTGLRPWTILLGLFIWGKLLGFLGLVLAIPLTCMLLAYYSRFVLGKLDAQVVQDQQPGGPKRASCEADS